MEKNRLCPSKRPKYEKGPIHNTQRIRTSAEEQSNTNSVESNTDFITDRSTQSSVISNIFPFHHLMGPQNEVKRYINSLKFVNPNNHQIDIEYEYEFKWKLEFSYDVNL